MTAQDDYFLIATIREGDVVMLGETYTKMCDEIDRLRKFETDAMDEINSLNAMAVYYRQQVREMRADSPLYKGL